MSISSSEIIRKKGVGFVRKSNESQFFIYIVVFNIFLIGFFLFKLAIDSLSLLEITIFTLLCIGVLVVSYQVFERAYRQIEVDINTGVLTISNRWIKRTRTFGPDEVTGFLVKEISFRTSYNKNLSRAVFIKLKRGKKKFLYNSFYISNYYAIGPDELDKIIHESDICIATLAKWMRTGVVYKTPSS